MVYYVDYVLVGDEHKWAAMTGQDATVVNSNNSLEELMKDLNGKKVFLSDIAGHLLNDVEDYESSLAEYKNVQDYLKNKEEMEQMKRDLDAPDPFDPE